VSQENVELERRLREAGLVFIEAHDRAALAIREAADAGMNAEAIAQTSGLSPATVLAFLRAVGLEP
jgi:predicted transcriptional regulator